MPLLRVGVAAAAALHLLGEADLGHGLPPISVGVAAAAVVLAPRCRPIFLVLAATIWWSVWDEAPVVGNHWMLTALVATAAGLGALSARPSAAVAGPQIVVLVFYSFAAFAKLNADFFDPDTSCAPFYAGQTAETIGWRLDPLRGASAWAVMGATALVELSVPALLLLRRTRAVGVAVGVAFHTLLALDTQRPFYSFTALLLSVFVTFLPSAAGVAWRQAVARRVRPRVLGLVGATLASCAGVLSGGRASPDLAFDLGFAAWWLAALVVVPSTLVWVWRHRQRPAPALRGPTRWAAPVVLLAVLNGLSPYFEVKTATAWNMYSNLRTVDGDSNHFLVRATLPIGDANADLVRVVDADPPLDGHAEAGSLLPRRQLRWYLQHHPELRASLLVDGRRVAVRPGAIPAELGGHVPDAVGRLLALQVVRPDGEPQPCEVELLPRR